MTDDSENAGRRRFLVGSTSVVGAVGVAGAAVPFVGSWNPSAKARAAGAPVRIDISVVCKTARCWALYPPGVVGRSSLSRDQQIC